MKPGATLTTLTPFGPTSFDRPLLYAVSATLAAAYASVESWSGGAANTSRAACDQRSFACQFSLLAQEPADHANDLAAR